MARSASIQLTGFKELEKALLSLPAELAKEAEAGALRAGMVPVRRATIANAAATKDTGLLQKSIGLTVRRIRKKGQNTNRYTARVGPRTGFKKSLGTRIAKVTKGNRKAGKPYEAFQDPVRYAHLVELGTSRSAAKPFIRPALDSQQGEIIERMAQGYNKGLARAVAKLRKK